MEVVSLDEVEASEEKAAEPVVDDIDVEEDAEDDARGRSVPGRGRGGRRRRQQPHRRRHRPRRGNLSDRVEVRRPALEAGGEARGFFGPSALVGARKFAVIPPPSESKARFAPIGARRFLENGAIAQLGERFNGIEEVVGSIPSGSTKNINSLSQIISWQRTMYPIR